MIRKRNFWGIIGFSFTLVFFRESNVFALPGIALFYLINKEFRKLWISLAFTSLCLLLIFKIRPYLLGPTYDYGGYFLSGLSSSPLGFVWSKIVSFDIKAFLKVFFPILIPAYFILKKEGRIPLKSPIVLLGMMIAPLLFLHFLAGKIHYHYAVTFIAPLLSYLVLSPKFDEFTQNKKWFYLTLALFFFTSTSTYTKWFKLSVLHKTDKCIISTDKRNSFLELREVIKKEIPLEKSIFSSGRVVPRLMTVGRKYYVPSPFTVHLESYDFLLMEKNFGGEFRSLTKDRYEKMLSLCVDTESQIILNNEFFFLMRGPIGPTCYNYFSFM